MPGKVTGIDPMHVVLMSEHTVRAEIDGHTHYLYAPPWIENPGCNCAGPRLPWWHRILTTLAMRRPALPVCGGHSQPDGHGLSKVDMDVMIGTVMEHNSHG